MLRKTMLVLFLGSAVTAQAVSPYVSFSGGLNMLQENDYTWTDPGDTGTGSIEFDAGFVLEGAVGLAFDSIPLRTEIELSLQENDIDQFNEDGSSSPGDGSGQGTLAYMWNGYFDIKLNSPLTPYIFAGIGGADVGNDDTLLAYQLGAGIGYALNKNIILDLKYKYFMTEDYEVSDSTDKLELDGLVSHQVQIGIRYQF